MSFDEDFEQYSINRLNWRFGRLFDYVDRGGVIHENVRVVINENVEEFPEFEEKGVSEFRTQGVFRVADAPNLSRNDRLTAQQSSGRDTVYIVGEEIDRDLHEITVELKRR